MYYRRIGAVPKKRHSQFRGPDGELHLEELVGEQGFFHSSSLLYHRGAPNMILAAEAVDVPALWPARQPNSPLMPRMFQTRDLPAGGDVGHGPSMLAGQRRDQDLVRDRGCDEPAFPQRCGRRAGVRAGRLREPRNPVRRARGRCRRLREGADGLRPPLGTWGTVAARMLILEATGHVEVPDRYLSPRGQLLEHAPYSERDFRGPPSRMSSTTAERRSSVKHRDGVTRHTFAHHPFDVIGWDGCVYPWAFSIYDYEPIVKRFHAPPSVLETFSGPGWVVCSFCPRPADYDPMSVPAPYAHSAIDCDEMMFFVAGDYTIRRGTNVGQGSITFHPAGWVHGPHPGGAEASIGKANHDEYAVMVDTFKPLSLGPAAALVADPEYHTSWATHQARGK